MESTTLEAQAMDAGDALAREHMPNTSDEFTKTLLAMAWLGGYGHGVETGRDLAIAAIDGLKAQLDS